jgi:hypothetical protein
MNCRHRRGASIYRRWHRFFALIGALFLVFLALSGSAINHGEFLGLSRQSIERPWLLSWYGLRAPAILESYALAGQTLTWAGNRLYLDGHEAATTSGFSVGAVATPDLLIVASSDALLLLTPSGELVERLRISQIDPGAIDAIGRSRSGLVVLGSGSQLLQADRDLLSWQPLLDDRSSVHWSAAVPTPEAIRQLVVHSYQGPGLSLEKLLLDLHSGRFFGSAGVIIYDLLALVLVTLALSGLILWQRGRRDGGKNGR